MDKKIPRFKLEMPLRRHRVTRRRRPSRLSRRRKSHSRNRRASRRMLRRNRRTRRRAMYGGAQHVVRFKVDFLEDIDAHNDNEDLTDDEIVNLVSQKSNIFYDEFNRVLRELIDDHDIDEQNTNQFTFTHLGGNRFEMKFEVLHQGEQAQKIAQETTNIVLEGISEYASVNIDGTMYGVNVEKEEAAA